MRVKSYQYVGRFLIVDPAGDEANVLVFENLTLEDCLVNDFSSSTHSPVAIFRSGVRGLELAVAMAQACSVSVDLIC